MPGLGCLAALSRNSQKIIFYSKFASGYLLYDSIVAAKCVSLSVWDRGTMHMQKTYKRNKGHFTELGRAAWLLYDLKKDTYRNDWVLLESS